MRRIVVTLTATALAVPAFAGTAAASHTPTVSDNASNNACFGQWRASTADGSVFAERKGTNSEHNAANKAACSHA